MLIMCILINFAIMEIPDRIFENEEYPSILEGIESLKLIRRYIKPFPGSRAGPGISSPEEAKYVCDLGACPNRSTGT